ncbi:MAG: DegT/DnrJ/EryC1/StrS family aminotransferase [Oligoflexia bacterium]|nr:DegT/DnrJ/EryC1/StrS family aminotransferase [Oligoflexia bacterium]
MDNQKILDGVGHDLERSNNLLHLTANENQMSNTARSFLGSKLSERYYFGSGDEKSIVDFGHLVGLGLPGCAELIGKAEEAAKKMLHAKAVNLNVLSGVHAMMSAILSVSRVSDGVMTVPEESGGHFATKGIVEVIGRKHYYTDFDYINLRFDTAKIAKSVRGNDIKVIYLDVSYYLNPHNIRELREAVGNEVIIIYDASHTLGLIMGGQFQSPLEEGANIICGNTHKTFPGPHKGLIAFRDQDLADSANAIINACLYSSPHLDHLLALSVTILEMEQFGEVYSKQIVANSNALAKSLVSLGYEVRKSNTGEYSHNHQVHLFVDELGDRLDLYKRLLNNNISTHLEGTELTDHGWYIRLGTAEPTRLGMKEAEMDIIAKILDQALKGQVVKSKVTELVNEYCQIHYSFDI